MSINLSACFNRREMLTAMAGAFAAGRALAAPDQALTFPGLDHVAIAVSDVERSVSFYSRVFGRDVLKDSRSPRRYLKIGRCYIAIAGPAQGQPAGRIDHICPGIGGYDSASVKSALEQRGFAPRETAVGWYVADPEGIQIQLWTENSWSKLSNAAPEKLSGSEEPLFRATGLDHILIQVTDPEKSAKFYERLFGPVSQRGNDRIWFRVGTGRIGLRSLESGGPAVHHFCVSTSERIDYDAALQKLEALGARPVKPEVQGAPEFHDPDGILVQVMGPRGAAKKS
jgi:catechol 2,3-dioxygenase-like lactoylglutathione lyase family enzyme